MLLKEVKLTRMILHPKRSGNAQISAKNIRDIAWSDPWLFSAFCLSTAAVTLNRLSSYCRIENMTLSLSLLALSPK
jgi:hypothetical protein